MGKTRGLSRICATQAKEEEIHEVLGHLRIALTEPHPADNPLGEIRGFVAWLADLCPDNWRELYPEQVDLLQRISPGRRLPGADQVAPPDLEAVYAQLHEPSPIRDQRLQEYEAQRLAMRNRDLDEADVRLKNLAKLGMNSQDCLQLAQAGARPKHG